jgi:hypothetical protein
MEAYINNIQVEVKSDMLPWQKRGLMYTRTGYGRKIPTSYKVKYNNRWYRVYCCIFSNCGTLYIVSKNEDVIVSTY